MQEFIGRTAVITGATSSLGRAIARRAADIGMCVVLADRDDRSVHRLAANLRRSGAEVLAVAADPSSSESVRDLAGRTLDRFGAVHLLINIPILPSGELAWHSPIADWERTFDLMFLDTLRSIQLFVPLMRATNTPGAIVNVISDAVLIPGSRSTARAAAGAAVVALTERIDSGFHLMKTALRASVVYAHEADSLTRKATRAAAAGGIFDGIAVGQVHILADPVATLAKVARSGELLGSRHSLPPTPAGK